MTPSTTPFDPADYLSSPEAMAEYLAAAFESGETAVIADALGVVARARGMTDLSEKTGLPRQTLYKALDAAGNPSLDTLLRIMSAMGLRLAAAPAAR